MKRLIFDIETLPADEKSKKALEYLFGRKLEKKTKKEDAPEIKYEDFAAATSFDGAFGRILCIAYAVNDEPVRVISNVENEKKVLEDFWFVAGQCDLFVGHNIMDFDLRFILQRSIMLGVKPSWDHFGVKRYNDPNQKYLSFARYQHSPIFDTMHEWVNWGQGKAGLEHIAIALGLETPKQGIDGSQVYEFFKAGKIAEICEYCKRDVETTRAVYKRMIFADKLS